MTQGARGPFRGEHAAHLDAFTRPENAIISGRAIGAEGDRVGVAGMSVSNAGVHAQSRYGIGLRGQGGELAAEFDGGVLLHGNLTIEGQLSAPVVADLLDRVRELEERVFYLSRRVLQLQTTINS
jgi:hypothetical protein